MPCHVCHSQLVVFKDIATCPNCKNLSIVPYDDALTIANYYIELFKIKLENILKKFEKNELLIKIFWEREKEIIRFNEIYSTLDLSMLTATSLLIRRINKIHNFTNSIHANENDIKNIIEVHIQLMNFEEDKIKLEANTWNMINFVPYDINKLSDLSLNWIQVCPNESYGRVMQTFAKHNIMSEKNAEEKMKKWSKDVIYSERGSNQSKTSKETIERFYEMISMLYTAFLRNSVYVEAFQLPTQELDINPIDIKKLLGRYPISHVTVTKMGYSLFREDLIMIFKGKFQKILSNFVLSEDNLEAMPIFIKIKDEIFISQAFGELYCYFLHAIVNKQEFDEETIRRSKIYEQKIVRSYFENQGFRYFNSFKIKNKMEIDGIAISENKVYVIEVKGWASHKLLEEKTTRDILNREIKNAIDGIHIHQDTKTIKQKVSIKQKINWVSRNRESFKIKKDIPIHGLLIINESPTIMEYHNCKVKFIDNFIYYKTGTKIMQE